jgi:hypothetical protein
MKKLKLFKSSFKDIVDEVQIKSEERKRNHGEVFTSKREVNNMLDLVLSETLRIESKFLETACGTGNFLCEILLRKISVIEKKYVHSQIDFEKYSLIAISSLYGIDILEDNVIYTQERLYKIFEEKYYFYYLNNCKKNYLKSIKFILKKNIIHGDALTLKTISQKPSAIIFCDWSFIGSTNIKRRDFSFKELIAGQPFEGPNLFSDLGEDAFIPDPIKEYPATDFLKIHENH